MRISDWSSDVCASDLLDSLLRETVAGRMVADVDLGALLSGGVDSSLIVAVMQSLSDRPVKTFSVGFEEPRYDEAPHAKRIARHLKTDHHEIYLKPADCLDVVQDLPSIFDEPFADSSRSEEHTSELQSLMRISYAV